MIKRIVSVLLIAVMALGTTGCGGEKGGNTEEPQTTTEGERTTASAVATTPEETAPVETTTDIVDYLHANDCNSIMYYSQEKDDITREFTALEAYYTGLIDYHEDVKKWGLGQSDFFLGQ